MLPTMSRTQPRPILPIGSPARADIRRSGVPSSSTYWHHKNNSITSAPPGWSLTAGLRSGAGLIARQGSNDAGQVPEYAGAEDQMLQADAGESLIADDNWVVPTGALPFCQDIGNQKVRVSAALASRFFDGLDPDTEFFDISISSMTQEGIVALTVPERNKLMNALDKCTISYAQYGFMGQKYWWTRKTMQGDVALLVHLLQQGHYYAFGLALAAHFSSEGLSGSRRSPQDVVNDLCNLPSSGRQILSEVGTMYVMQLAVENVSRKPRSPDPENRPFAENKTELLDAAGTILQKYIQSLSIDDSGDAFASGVTGLARVIQSRTDDREALYGITMGVFLAACFKANKEMSDSDRSNKEFWMGLSDGFWSILATGVSAACPAAGLAPAAIGAVMHAILGSCLAERDYQRGINKLKASLEIEQMDESDAPFSLHGASWDDLMKFFKSENMKSKMELAFHANGFTC